MTRSECLTKLQKDGFSIEPSGLCRKEGYWFMVGATGFTPLKPKALDEFVSFDKIGDWYE